MKHIHIKTTAIPNGVEDAYIEVDFRERGVVVSFIYDQYTDSNKWGLPNVLAKKELQRVVMTYQDMASLGLTKDNLLSRLKDNGPTRRGNTRRLLRNIDKIESLPMPDTISVRVEFSQPTQNHIRNDRFFRKVDYCPVAVIYNDETDISFAFDKFERFGSNAPQAAYECLYGEEKDSLIRDDEVAIRTMRKTIAEEEYKKVGGPYVEKEDELI